MIYLLFKIYLFSLFGEFMILIIGQFNEIFYFNIIIDLNKKIYIDI